jgi:hypothetical protein
MANYGHLFYPEGEIVYTLSNWEGNDEKIVYWKVLEYNPFKTSIDYIVDYIENAKFISLDRQIAIIECNGKRFEIVKYFGHLARFVIRVI